MNSIDTNQQTTSEDLGVVVTIDGPAGAGKSSAARHLAKRLGFWFLDTGAMYRAVALAALRGQWPLDDAQQLAQRAAQLTIELADGRVLLDGEDVSQQIRRSDVTDVIHHVADNAEIRQQLSNLQREFSQGKDVVTEGRDQGTVVFPDAECKIFLTATAKTRAQRRWDDLRKQGEEVSYEQVLAQQESRDQRDADRPVGRLIQAEDAAVVVTDGLSLDEVVDHLEYLVRQR